MVALTIRTEMEVTLHAFGPQLKSSNRPEIVGRRTVLEIVILRTAVVLERAGSRG